MELIHSFVSAHNVLISAGLLILAYIFIATEKIPKVTIALLGAGITIFLGLVSQTRVLDGVLNPTYFVQYIDFNVIFLLVSMMIIVNITTRSGVFSYLANELLKMTKGHPVLILIALGIFTAVVSAFLDNVTTVILIMPITFAIARKLEIDPIPYLLTEVFASNIGGTATLIGDPPNIIIGSAAGFSFMDFVNNLTLVVAVILIAVLAVMVLFFRKKLATTAEKMKEAAIYFIGEHDFAAFKSSGTSSKSSVRTIYDAKIYQNGDKIYIELTGNGFLYNMVRIISGTLLEVGQGTIKPEEIEKIIQEKGLIIWKTIESWTSGWLLLLWYGVELTSKLRS